MEERGYTVENIFQDEAIESYAETKLGFVFSLKEIDIPINVCLSPRAGSVEVDFELSHYIKTPLESMPYIPSRQAGDYYEYALKRAVSSITDYYRLAVKNGHTPSENWLYKNPSF